ncbi:hypothetical protein BZA05DRAFT_129015 [Tricharina praecox]|uniref:uncharacterized protein n=1 Tax=Tricharina praecox TaxID=43433 RepID=UPI002220F45A|nr:uncharacterized protein BZA05DRAFT_129015 [Tricharina praecox]KAI5846867.1 hypothetical protein BZA05DRAFT_129015 [Tricharina praecox]
MNPALLLLLTFTTLSSGFHSYPQPQPPQAQQLLATSSNNNDNMALMSDKPSGPPLLGDILPLDKQISIFSGFTRSIESISELLQNRNENTTVLAPSNTAISRLPRKPWEEPDDSGAAGAAADLFAGIMGEDRATRNLRRFVEAHCVGTAPWKEGVKVRTLEGVEVWWEKDASGRKRVMPDGIEVLQVKDDVANGQLWVLGDVLNYDR